MDWHTFNAAALVLPRNYEWTSVYNNQKMINPYAILGVGNSEMRLHADISDGVNEYGLAAQKLTFQISQIMLKKQRREKFNLLLLNFCFGCWGIAVQLRKFVRILIMYS